MDINPLSPFYRIEIKNEAQARLYQKLLIMKIAALLVVLIAVFVALHWSFYQIIGMAAFATVVQLARHLWRQINRRLNSK